LGLHCYAVSTHPDELVPEPPLKKILDPPMILLTKLEHHGVRANAFELVQSYFSNRKQYVQEGNTKSSLKSIISGAPQG